MEQLTTDQIQAVDTFVRDRYIQYEDVRIEIVDHLATEIEAEMALNSDDSFTKLLWKIGDKYGPELKKLVKVSERKMVWFWVKQILRQIVKNFFSFYILFPIGVYLITVYSSLAGGFSILLIGAIIIHQDRLYTDVSTLEDEEASRFLATKTYKWVMNYFMFLFITIFQFFRTDKLLDLGIFVLDTKAFGIASLATFIMISKSCANLLESYYKQRPTLASKRVAFKDEFDNRKWKARKY
jgi:hypothetical protein